MSEEVREGEVLAGKFRIERVLGQGAMGVVVAATHIQLDERVALKFLLPEALHHPDAVARFAREARAAVKIKSEHVARVSDVGTLENGSPYMVMEYLQGQDLSEWLQARGPLPAHDAVDFLTQACEALAEAHVMGIVHRDLKPANLFITSRADGTHCIKVLDFGISKFTAPGSASDMGMTKTATVMGSPLYMSPEQLSSTRGVDARTDIWAIGVILFELISGRVPFEAESMPQLCGMVLQESPPSLRELRPDIPEGLEAVVLRCMAKDRAQRFASVAELAFALAPFGSPAATRSAERIARVLRASGPMSVVESGSQASLTASTAHAVSLKAEPDSAPSRRGPLVLLSVLVVALALVLFLATRRSAPTLEHAAEPVLPHAAGTTLPTPVPTVSAELPQTVSTGLGTLEPTLATSAAAKASPSLTHPAARVLATKAAPVVSAPPENKPAPAPTPVAAPAPAPAPVAPRPAPAPRADDVLDDRR